LFIYFFKQGEFWFYNVKALMTMLMFIPSIFWRWFRNILLLNALQLFAPSITSYSIYDNQLHPSLIPPITTFMSFSYLLLLALCVTIYCTSAPPSDSKSSDFNIFANYLLMSPLSNSSLDLSQVPVNHPLTIYPLHHSLLFLFPH